MRAGRAGLGGGSRLGSGERGRVLGQELGSEEVGGKGLGVRRAAGRVWGVVFKSSVGGR